MEAHEKNRRKPSENAPPVGFSCLVCRAGEADLALRACQDYYLGRPFVVDYVRCRSCGLLQQCPLPEDVSLFYDRYPIHTPKSAAHRIIRRLVMAPVYFQTTSLPRGSVLLDYGCGDGGFLEAQGDKGFERIGYEPDPEHAATLKRLLGIPIYADAEALLRERTGQIDVLTMHFVLEHLTDLDEAFGRVSRLLRPGGEFYFVVPHASSFEARLFGKRWHNLDPPRHISFPERPSVTALASRSGMELTADAPVAFPNGFAGSLPVVLSGRFRFPLFALSLPLAIAFSRLCPTGTHAYRVRKAPAP